MATPNQNSSEVLREEILAEARRESERIVCYAQQEAEALLARAAAEADQVRQERVSQARAEADRRRELILATVPVEAGRLRLDRVEALLDSVRQEIDRRLSGREGFDYRDTVVTLAAEAIQQMDGSAFVVKLSAADYAALGDALGQEIARRIGRSGLSITLANDATLTGGGAVIEDTQGSQVWDNRLKARLERLWPELRRQIAVKTALVGGSGATGGVA